MMATDWAVAGKSFQESAVMALAVLLLRFAALFGWMMRRLAALSTAEENSALAAEAKGTPQVDRWANCAETLTVRELSALTGPRRET